MNNEDMSNLINKFSSFMGSSNNSDKKNISPEFIQNVAKMMNNTSNSDENKVEANANSNDRENNGNDNKENINSNFDIQTILKMKKIFDELNKKNDPRANLLISLKPYLNDNRKQKVDQYIKFFNISRVIEALNNQEEKL